MHNNGVLGRNQKKDRKKRIFFRSAWNMGFEFELYDIEQRDLSWLVDAGQRRPIMHYNCTVQ
jgi:hypothetical protein